MKIRRERAADLVDPLVAILRKLTEEKAWDAGFEIIGSWCFLLYQRHLPMEKYPFKTEDLDILIPRPFKGRPSTYRISCNAWDSPSISTRTVPPSFPGTG